MRVTVYYIVDRLIKSDNDLPVGLRIIKMKATFPGIVLKFRDGDGPFLSIDELKHGSKRFRDLVRLDPKRAEKILKNEFIAEVQDAVAVPQSISESFGNEIFQMLVHSISGNVSSRNVMGIHYFDAKFHRIVNITKPANAKGVWEAIIEARHKHKDTWIQKQRASTFFPTNWTKEELVTKLYSAFQAKQQTGDYSFVGRTGCSIEVVFIVKGNKIVSVYPKAD